ncbi:MAG: ATP synthase F1 subunit gamma [bacterium]
MELKEIRRKIESVNNIRNLTSALETLSALKMKKAQKTAILSRPFSHKIAVFLEEIEPLFKEKKSVFFREEKAGKILFVAITSDRGFCGSFNQNILRRAEKEIKERSSQGTELIEVFPVGKKGTAFFKKRGRDIKYSFIGIGDAATLEEVKPISDFLIKSFLEKKFQEIHLVWSDFVSTFLQKPRHTQILPLKKENLEEFFGREDKYERREFLVEPSLRLLAKEVVPQLVEYLIYQAILENNASEHSARMMAMRNASDNAQKKSSELKLEYNKARQEQITSEVLEISSAKEVLD